MELVGRMDAEAAVARKLARLHARQHAELSRRLSVQDDVTLDQTFWGEARREYEEEVAALLLLLFGVTGRQALADSGVVADSRGGDRLTGLVDQAAQSYATTRSRELAIEHIRTAQDRLETAIREWKGQLATGKAISRAQQAADTVKVFGPERAEAQAVTETTAVRQAAVEEVAALRGLTSTMDQWKTVGDQRVCPICKPLEGSRRDAWSQRFPSGPPAHPRCRCVILYQWERPNGDA